MTCHSAMWLIETQGEQRGVRSDKDFRQVHSRDVGIQTQPISSAMAHRSVTSRASPRSGGTVHLMNRSKTAGIRT
jgi:hypothetical protein